MQRSEFSIEDIGRGRTMMIGDLDYIEEQGGYVFECNKVRSNPTPPAMDQGHTPASITQPKGWETDFFDDFFDDRPLAPARVGAPGQDNVNSDTVNHGAVQVFSRDVPGDPSSGPPHEPPLNKPPNPNFFRHRRTARRSSALSARRSTPVASWCTASTS